MGGEGWRRRQVSAIDMLYWHNMRVNMNTDNENTNHKCRTNPDSLLTDHTGYLHSGCDGGVRYVCGRAVGHHANRYNEVKRLTYSEVVTHITSSRNTLLPHPISLSS